MKKHNVGAQASITPSEEESTLTPPTEETNQKEEVIEEKVTEPETPVVTNDVPDVKYREVVYLGIANEAERIGAVTGTQYIFHKDEFGMPVGTQVDERDYPGIISERGKGCARRDPSILFMSKLEWDLEVEQARIANNS